MINNNNPPHILESRSRWAIGAFVRFLNNGPSFTDLVDAFPPENQPHLKRKLDSILADSIEKKGSYVQNVIDFYNYLDKKNKCHLLYFIQQWADDRDEKVKPTAETDTRQLPFQFTDKNGFCPDPNIRQESNRLMFLAEERVRLQAENENLKTQLANRDLNIRNLTSLLDSIPPRHTDEELENLAYYRDNFIDDRMDFYAHFGLCEEEARESAEEDALEHFPAALAVSQ